MPRHRLYIPHSAFRIPHFRRGFTLTEVLITVVIVGILAAMAVPTYRKTVERAYWREAGDLLMTIYYGERAYHLQHTTYTNPGTNWKKIFMENPNLSSIPVTFTVHTATATDLEARATRDGGPCSGQKRTIDENRNLSGDQCWPSSSTCSC